MRVAAIFGYQERIDHNMRDNLAIAKALNNSRIACVVIPLVGVALALIAVFLCK